MNSPSCDLYPRNVSRSGFPSVGERISVSRATESSSSNPFTRHGWTRQVGCLHGLEKLDELFGLGRGDELALLAIHVLLVDQAVDRIGARGRRSQAALLH